LRVEIVFVHGVIDMVNDIFRHKIGKRFFYHVDKNRGKAFGIVEDSAFLFGGNTFKDFRNRWSGKIGRPYRSVNKIENEVRPLLFFP